MAKKKVVWTPAILRAFNSLGRLLENVPAYQHEFGADAHEKMMEEAVSIFETLVIETRKEQASKGGKALWKKIRAKAYSSNL